MKSTIAFLLLLPLLAAMSLFGKPEAATSYRPQEDPNITSWLSKKEAEHLMRYHGAAGLKITSDKVFIRRDNRWICIYHDPPYPFEKSVASGISGETVVAHSGRP
jgi:ABC-type uncharacterized transport system auxiliary subunit